METIGRYIRLKPYRIKMFTAISYALPLPVELILYKKLTEETNTT